MATRLSGRVRRLEQTRGTCGVYRGKGKVVVGYAQPELAIRTAIDDGQRTARPISTSFLGARAVVRKCESWSSTLRRRCHISFQYLEVARVEARGPHRNGTCPAPPVDHPHINPQNRLQHASARARIGR